MIAKLSLGTRDPIAVNGLWLLRSVLFGVRSASLSQKYCNKIKQISTEN
jgi:hypothetical protein